MREFAPSPQTSYVISFKTEGVGGIVRKKISFRIFEEDKLYNKEHRIYVCEFASKVSIKSTENVVTLYLNIVGIFGLHLIVRLVSREGSCGGTFCNGSFRGSPKSCVLEFPSCSAAAGRISLAAVAPASFDLPALSVLSEKVTRADEK